MFAKFTGCDQFFRLVYSLITPYLRHIFLHLLLCLSPWSNGLWRGIIDRKGSKMIKKKNKYHCQK